MITSKEQIINYFNSGIKSTKNFKIGIEHEKFLFNNKDNKRVDYSKIKEMFNALLEFGWNPILEEENIIGLNKKDKNITLEPGNQIELSGDKLNNIHEAAKNILNGQVRGRTVININTNSYQEVFKGY